MVLVLFYFIGLAVSRPRSAPDIAIILMLFTNQVCLPLLQSPDAGYCQLSRWELPRVPPFVNHVASGHLSSAF
ncbi:hypothetical protein CPC08DRAFT_709841 [Agrocybe pediades]|nr:hypothetical protein CPC08DRAFT_709841 [Agrocybe pediades]